MAAPPTAADRPFDPVAVEAALHRLVRQPQPPWLHAEVARRMGERLQVIRLQPALILDWWGYLGAGARVLASAYPLARRVVVEPDERWLERSREPTGSRWWPVRSRRRGAAEAMLESDALPDGAQLVWANMMLHAVADPPALFVRWERLLRLDGFVMFSCPGPDTLRGLRELYRRLGWPPPAADFIDMHDLGDMLVEAGFADPVMDQETLDVRWESPLTLVDDLRRLGGNTARSREPGLRTPRWRERLLHELEALRGPDGKLALGLEIAYGHAFKSAPRVRADTPTTVSLEDMRAMVRTRRGPASAS
jgi:malonyl-CoA O-methyltransferase